MIFRNNKSNNLPPLQQPKVENLKTVVVTYPHRRENGLPLVRIRFVSTTAEPDFRYTSFNAWCMRIKRELIIAKSKGGYS